MKNDYDPWENITIESWSDFDSQIEKLNYKVWLYRGQSDAEWQLKTSLDRLFEDIQPLIKMHKGHGRNFAKNAHESLLIKKFQQNAHLYLSTLPKVSERLEWLALMQHYGVSTRLLDVTLSPYIAAYFALEARHGDCCVFAFNHLKLKAEDTEIKSNEDYQKLVFKNQKEAKSFIFPFEPKLSNERLVSQQGLFLVPSTNYETFQSLLSWYDFDGSTCKKFIIPGHLRYAGLVKLRMMNITSASLFPGIDGFCRSLRYQILETTQSLRAFS